MGFDNLQAAADTPSAGDWYAVPELMLMCGVGEAAESRRVAAQERGLRPTDENKAALAREFPVDVTNYGAFDRDDYAIALGKVFGLRYVADSEPGETPRRVVAPMPPVIVPDPPEIPAHRLVDAADTPDLDDEPTTRHAPHHSGAPKRGRAWYDR